MTQQIPVNLKFSDYRVYFGVLGIGQMFVFKNDERYTYDSWFLQNKVWTKVSNNEAKNRNFETITFSRDELYDLYFTPITIEISQSSYTFDKYNEQCQQTKQDWSTYSSTEIDYCIIAMLGELGEFANKYKKLIRGDYQNLKETYSILLDELGDVLWYFNQLVQLFGSSLAIVAMRNVTKLIRRKEQGTIHNSLNREE